MSISPCSNRSRKVQSSFRSSVDESLLVDRRLATVVRRDRKLQLGQAVYHSAANAGNVDDRPDPVVLAVLVIDVLCFEDLALLAPEELTKAIAHPTDRILGVPVFGWGELGFLLYQSLLVPRVLPLLEFIGAPLLLASDLAVLFGLVERVSALPAIAALPIALW